MTKHELGQKHFCTNCGAKFYDLTRSPPTCPKCETVVEPVERARPTRSPAKAKAKPAKVEPVAKEEAKQPAETDEDVSVDVDVDVESSDDDDAADDVIEDVSELGEDEADMAGVVSADDETT